MRLDTCEKTTALCKSCNSFMMKPLLETAFSSCFVFPFLQGVERCMRRVCAVTSG